MPRLLCKRGLRLPKCYQIKVKKFPFTNPEVRRKRPRVCCLWRSMSLQSWLELPLRFAYLNVKLKSLLRLCSGGLLPEAGDEDACLEPCLFWTVSSQVSLIGVEFEVRAPEINFPETWGVQPQGFYLSLSLAWLQGKAEWTLQARSLQMQKIIGFKMSLAVHIMDILWILWLDVVFSWPMLPSWCNL